MLYKDKLKEIRKIRKIPRRTLAEGIGKSIKTIQRWEMGEQEPSEFCIRQMANFLCVPVTEISDLQEKEVQEHLFYNKLSALDKSTFNLSTKTESEKQKLFISLQKKIDILSWEKKQLTETIEADQLIYKNVDCIIYKKNIKMKYEYINQKFISYFNITNKAFVLGASNNEIWKHLTAWQKIDELEKEVLHNGVNIENTIVSLPQLSGIDNIGILSIKPVYNSDNKISGLVGTIIDVTEDLSIKEKFSYMESILDKISQAIWIIKRKPYRHYMYVNKPVEDIYSIFREDFYKDVNIWQNHIAAEDKKRVLKEYKNGNSQLVYRVKADNNENEDKWVKHNFYISEINGEEIEFSSINDITEIIHWEQANEFLKLIIEQVENSFIWKSAIDPDGNITYQFISKNIRNILGYDQEYFYKNVSPLEKHIHPDHKNIFEQSFLSKDISSIDFEILVEASNGKYKWFDFKAKKVVDRNKVINIYGIAADITEKKELEGALHEYYASEIEQAKITEKINIIKNMKSEGAEVAFIARCTKLSVKEVKKIVRQKAKTTN